MVKSIITILTVLVLSVPAMACSVTLSGVDDDGGGPGLTYTV